MQEKENKNQNILIRVSPTEKKKIEEKAEQVHKTVAGYLLDLTESKRVIDTTIIAALIIEIRKIGVKSISIRSLPLPTRKNSSTGKCCQRFSKVKKKSSTFYRKFSMRCMTRRNIRLKVWKKRLTGYPKK